MTKAELIAAMSQYPDNWTVMVNFENIETVEWIEGTTSDGPGSINIQGDGE